MSTRRSFLRGALCLGAATAAWTTGAHEVFAPWRGDLRDQGALPSRVRAMLEHQLHMWEGGPRTAFDAMRRFNPEWDLMGRTFLVLAMADVALRLPGEADRLISAMDKIIADTEARARTSGLLHFLLPYGRIGAWNSLPAKSLFVEGELAVMHGARRVVREDAGHAQAMAPRVQSIVALMGDGPVRCGESYPDECWTFCNAMALVALRMHEHLDGADHGALRAAWIAHAKSKLTHVESGLLVSSFTWDGIHKDGPEGSTIWLTAKSLLLVDPQLARDQYRRARSELRRSLLGFGWATEWPESWRGPVDIDSGAIVPVLQASPASSGHAVAAARAFGDEPFYRELIASLELAGFPAHHDGRRRYLAGNQVGDAVLLHGMVHGPLWRVLGGAA